MLDQMGVILAELKIEEMRHEPTSYDDNGARGHDQPGRALKQVGRVLQSEIVGVEAGIRLGCSRLRAV